jgi:UDP-N-acetylglucosamine--N-acetylmuramyl-(pentapeptide) pyrophosphoryl-undecaprenol N-acetylglucosamine transferase
LFSRAYRAALSHVDAFKPEVVVGLGGGFSVPAVLAAARRRIPIILLEQNAVLGRANRMLLPLAHHVCLSYAKTAMPSRSASRASFTGNPLRNQILRTRTDGAKAERKCLLILGGSQGAKALNEVVVKAFARLKPLLADWRIVHQTGRETLDGVVSAYRDLGIQATVVPFLEDIGLIYAQTGLAISRAGGTTLAELAVHAIPSVLIPYPNSVRDHQAHNARQCEESGGAAAIPQSADLELTARRLCECLPALLNRSEVREARGHSSLAIAGPEASERVS